MGDGQCLRAVDGDGLRRLRRVQRNAAGQRHRAGCSVFPGLAAGDTAALKTAIFANLQADYAPYSINIVDTNPGGTFTRLVIGNTGTIGGTSLGIANEIDFRNKRFDNIVSAVANPHANPPVQANYSIAQAAQFMGNTASHELGHVLGLVHSDVAGTFEANGSNAAARTVVRNNEVMKAVQADADAFKNMSFGFYSKVKLGISQDGINVQPEVGAAVFTGPAAADPARNGDAGATFATAVALSLDPQERDCVIGSLGGADTADVFKFTGNAGQHVTFEAFSQVLSDADGAGTRFVGRIANPMDPVVEIMDSTGAIIVPEEYTTNFDFDGSNAGDFGSDSMIYDFVIPAAGQYAVRVTARGGGDATGDYELLVVPEPSGMAALLLGACVLGSVGRRRRHVIQPNG